MSLFRKPLSREHRSIFDPPTTLERMIESPLTFLSILVHHFLLSLRPNPRALNPPIRVVCISDTHSLIPEEIPTGDLLIHAGDLTKAGNTTELQRHIDWLSSLPHPQKIAIAGNHDSYLDPRSRLKLAEKDRSASLDWKGIRYLQHSSATVDFPQHRNRKLNIYGAPQIPWIGGDTSFAFVYPRGQDAWSGTVPEDTDILITHTPPKTHCDLDVGLGCEHLLNEIWRIRPRIHVCGHIHAGAGKEVLWWDRSQRTYEFLHERGRDGLFHNLINLRVWINLWFMLFYGLQGILWTRIWGGSQRATTLVNASLTYNNTGQLRNRAQIIEL